MKKVRQRTDLTRSKRQDPIRLLTVAGTAMVNIAAGATVILATTASMSPYPFNKNANPGEAANSAVTLTINLSIVGEPLPKQITLFTADSLAGATDLSGWQVSGVSPQEYQNPEKLGTSTRWLVQGLLLTLARDGVSIPQQAMACKCERIGRSRTYEQN